MLTASTGTNENCSSPWLKPVPCPSTALTSSASCACLCLAGLDKTYTLMTQNFQLGAYAGAAVALLLGLRYGQRMLGEGERYVETNEGSSLLPEVVVSWPKEYVAVGLAGCIFAALSLISAAAYIG